MKFTTCSAVWIALAAMTACVSAKHSPITQEELVRNTQEMFDSVAAGDQAPWKRYFAEDGSRDGYMDLQEWKMADRCRPDVSLL